MEKTVNFAVFKEKIIKTNELLNLLLERNKSLEKSQKWNQHLKSRLELSKNEINKLKLKNETLTYNFTTIEKNYTVLKEDHDDLKQQFNRLKVDSDHTINTLQVNYQLANQELSECQHKLSLLKPSENENVSEEETTRKKCKSPKKRRSPVKKDKKISGEVIWTKKIEHLQAEKEKLLSEKCDLQLEVYELKKQLENLKCYQDDIEKDKNEITALKTTFKETLESKNKEIEKLANKVKSIEKSRFALQEANEALRIENVLSQEKNSTIETEEDSALKQELTALKKDLSATIDKKNKEITKLSNKIECLNTEREKLQTENDKLRDENCSYQREIFKLKESKQKAIESCFVEQQREEVAPKRQKKESVTPTDEEISSIMQNMIVPMRVSPLNAQDEHEDYDLPSFESSSPVSKPPPPRYTDLKTIVNRRRHLMRRKKQLLARRKMQHVDIYGTLLALKKANIHFLISDNSLLLSSKESFRFPKTYFPNIAKYKHIEKRQSRKLMKELECSLCCCKKSYMLLKEGYKGGDCQLLGFKDIKDENCEPQKEMGHDFTLGTPVKMRKVCELFSNGIYPSCNECRSLPVVEENTVNGAEKQNEGVNNKSTKEQNTSSCSIKTTSDPFSQTRKRSRKSPRLSVMKKKTIEARNKLELRKFVDMCEDDPFEENPSSYNSVTVKSDDFVFKKPESKAKSPKQSFKRPVCSSRRSLRLKEQYHESNGNEYKEPEDNLECIPLESPKSPTPECEARLRSTPVLIPLERRTEEIQDLEHAAATATEKMPTSKIESLFNKLVIYSSEEEALNEVVREFFSQDPEYIAEAILERIALDIHDKADTKHYPAPLMTDVQRTMLGFMSKLEKSNIIGVFDSYLTLAEQRLLTCDRLAEFIPITRLYLAICKLQKKLTRMRKLCCDVFYFCGDLAVPFFFTVLTSWTEVLPHAADAKDFPVARVLVQIVYTSDCNKAGYNLMPLRDLLIKFYGYPAERWDYNEFFKELLEGYLKKPSRSSDFALLLYCKSRPEKWVYDTIDEHLKPLVSMNIQDNFKATLIILISNLYNRFSSKSEVNYLPGIREWLLSLITEGTPDVVKRCVYVSLNRLKKK